MSNQNQAIIKRSYTTTVTFAATPSEETRKVLGQYGFTYDGRSGNWYRSEKQPALVNEEQVAELIAA